MSTNQSAPDDDMLPEYDFSKGKRGQFYQPNAIFRMPVYLDEEVIRYLSALAQRKGVELSTIANDLLKRDIEIIETGK